MHVNVKQRQLIESYIDIFPDAKKVKICVKNKCYCIYYIYVVLGDAIGRYCLVHCYIELVSIKRTFTDRFKTNFDCKTAFTTTKSLDQKGFQV